MQIALFLQVIGVVVAASWGSYAAENVAGIHPVAKRGVQIGLCALAGAYVARVLGLL